MSMTGDQILPRALLLCDDEACGRVKSARERYTDVRSETFTQVDASTDLGKLNRVRDAERLYEREMRRHERILEALDQYAAQIAAGSGFTKGNPPR